MQNFGGGEGLAEVSFSFSAASAAIGSVAPRPST